MNAYLSEACKQLARIATALETISAKLPEPPEDPRCPKCGGSGSLPAAPGRYTPQCDVCQGSGRRGPRL